jgi:hypothetical protein
LVFNKKNPTSLLHFYAVVEGEKKLGCKKKLEIGRGLKAN